jgi:hypothetical protein
MVKSHFKIILIGIMSLVQSGATAQLRINAGKPDPMDSINLNVTRKVAALLEEQKVNKAISYFNFQTDAARKNITKQLGKISKDLQPIKAKAKVLFYNSYKNYKDSFNIDQVIYYNDEGRFYLFELFFLKADASSKVVNVFVKDPIALEKKRKEISEFKKKNPNISQPPQLFNIGANVKL